jgi:hypothetical protein
MSELSFYVRARNEAAIDSGDGLTWDLHGKDADAAPEVYVDSMLQLAGYTFDPGDQSTAASITFAISQAGSVVTCTYRWRYECDFEEDIGVWDVGKDANIGQFKDVNGRDLTAIGYHPCGSFKGTMTWEYMTINFWREFQTIAENAYTFDVERTSGPDEPQSLENLLCTTYPRFVEIPGVPDRVHVAFEFIQLA